MRWKIKRDTFFERRDARERWHQWFAWYPVRIGRHMVWLDLIRRKGKWYCSDDGGWNWEYQTINLPSW